MDLGRRERPSGGMDRKAEEEPIAELMLIRLLRPAHRAGKGHAHRVADDGTPRLGAAWPCTTTIP